MMDFIYELYQNDNFVLYLTIALVILIILFVLVLIFGKRDQKLEETRKLQKIEVDNAFKEEKKDPVKLESANSKTESEELEIPKKAKSIFDDTQVLPISKEPETNSLESRDEKDENVEVTSFKPAEETKKDLEPLKEEKVSKPKPLIDIEEESKPINLEQLEKNSFDDISLDLEKELSELESIKKEFNDIELPESKKEIVKEEAPKEETKKENKPYKSGPQVFSSVFVNKEKDEEKQVVAKSDIKKDERPKVNLFTIQDDEEEIELPSLKSEHKEEKKEPAKNFSFDDINGETYNIK